MKKCYHMTPLSRVRSISNTGLTPRSENNSKVINDEKQKVFFSEGMTGAVALYSDFQKHYDRIKAGNIEGVPQDRVKAIQETETMEEYLGGEGVYFVFDGTEIENEKNFMDGVTSQEIPAESLQVCLLRNNDTNNVSYSRYDIIRYMMSRVPVETINYSGKDEEDFQKASNKIQATVADYYKKYQREIDVFRYGNYTLETVSVRDFCKDYLTSKTSGISGQDIGKDTMNLLEDVEAVRAMEAVLDRDVRELELERQSERQTEKVREKKEDNQ